MNDKLLHYALVKAFQYKNDQQYCIYAIGVDRENRIIAESRNVYNTDHPVLGWFNHWCEKHQENNLHAEILLLERLKRKRIIPESIYIARCARGKSIRGLLAKPCKICQRAIEDYSRKKGVKINIYYTGM